MSAPSSAGWIEQRGFVDAAGRRLGIAVTRPASGGDAQPAIVLVPSLGARSRCSPLADAPASDGIAALFRALAGAGFVTMRVDPAGVGESDGPAYHDADLGSEIAGHRAAVEAIARDPGVDPDRVFLLGHSLGGVLAPLVARSGGVRGIAVYGTTSRRWSECLADTARRQLALAGLSGDELARESEHAAELYDRLLRRGQRPTLIFDERPDLARCRAAADVRGDSIHGRSIAYFRALDAIDVEAAWRSAGVSVLAIRGEHDFIVAGDDHERIAAWVRAEGRNASAVTLPGLDHDLLRQPSLAASFSARGRGTTDPAVAEILIGWMRGEPVFTG